LLAALEGRMEKRIAVQEYGKSNTELLDALRARGAKVTPVRVYQWDLPEDLTPLRDAVHRIAEGQADVAMFTTSIQILHLFRIAAEEQVGDAMQGTLRRMVIASIGPTTSETLEEYGLTPDITPSHPKMGFLVKETAEQAAAILERKRAIHA
jgi:uroporphyrinogen-III synthase